MAATDGSIDAEVDAALRSHGVDLGVDTDGSLDSAFAAYLDNPTPGGSVTSANESTVDTAAAFARALSPRPSHIHI
jgi:hypothetical protein